MTVTELIAELQLLPPNLKVKIAFDTGIRMDAEIAKRAKCDREEIVVITDTQEWNDREQWYDAQVSK